MAKGQQRGNREPKKPKAKKPPAGAVAAVPPARAFLAPGGTPKKK